MPKKKKRLKMLRKMLSLFIICTLLITTFGFIGIAENKSVVSESRLVELSVVEKLDYEGIKVKELPVNVQKLIQETSDAFPDGRAVFKSILDETAEIDDLNTLRIEDANGGKLYIFSDPVKYENAKGELQWIDTSMIPVQERGNYVLQNAANIFNAKFGKDATIGWTMDDAFTLNPTGGNALYAKATPQEPQLGNGCVTYPDAFGKNTTLEYINTATGVKENIILECPTKQNSFSFLYKSNTHIPVLSKDGKSIDIKTIDGEIAYQFSPLIIFDSYVGEINDFAHYSDDAWYEVKWESDGLYQIVYIVNPDWLNSPEIVWPVVIDPNVNYHMPNGSSDVLDTYVDQNSPTTVHANTSTSMKIGNANNKEILSFIKFKKVTLNSTKTLQYSDAVLAFYFLPNNSADGYLTCRRVTSDWYSGNGVTYNNRPSTTNEYSSSEWPDLDDADRPYFVYFDVTNSVALWLDKTVENHGFQISKTGASAWLRTCENSLASERPFLRIGYEQCGQAQGVTNNTLYYIRNLYSGKYITAGNTNLGNNTYKVIQANFTGAGNQQWNLSYLTSTDLDKVNNSGYYHIEPQFIESEYKYLYRLMLPSYEPVNGEDMTVQPAGNAGEERQSFRFIRCTPTFMVFRIQHGRRIYSGLDVEGPSTAAGAPIQNWMYNPHTQVGQQYFVLEKVNDKFFGLVNQLHTLAKTYANNNTTALHLTLQYMRRGKYNNALWQEVAGAIDTNFVRYVNNNNSTLAGMTAFSDNIIDSFVSSGNGAAADLPHIAAVMDGMLVSGTSFKSMVVGPNNVRNLCGWAGDLQTLIVDTIKKTNDSNDYNTFKTKFQDLLGSQQYSFGMPDVYADIDAYNMFYDWCNGCWGSVSLGTVMNHYYNGSYLPYSQYSCTGYAKRYTTFTYNNTKDTFKNAVGGYTNNTVILYVAPVQWPLFNGYTVKTNQSNAARDAFTDFIWNRRLGE